MSKLSLLYQAVGGTLFLAHLTEMPARVQARLARVLRDGEVTVVESRRTVSTRMRLIASTDASWDGAGRRGPDPGGPQQALLAHAHPGAAAARPARGHPGAGCRPAGRGVRGSRRAGARDRRCGDVAAVRVPVARERRRAAGAAADARAALRRPVAAPAGRAGIRRISTARRRAVLGSGTLREAKERFERDYILAVLERHRGRVGEAARALGIQRPNLYRKMRALRVSPPRAGVAGG